MAPFNRHATANMLHRQQGVKISAAARGGTEMLLGIFNFAGLAQAARCPIGSFGAQSRTGSGVAGKFFKMGNRRVDLIETIGSKTGMPIGHLNLRARLGCLARQL